MLARPICRRLHRLSAFALLAGPLVSSSPALGQPVVQALPDPAASDLSDALRRLAADPISLGALLDAGRASLQLGDIDAAAGFYARAQAIAPDDGRVLAGLARVAVGRHDAVAALGLFDRAAARGEPLDPYASERGLAYDLVGMNSRAQVLYGQALARQNNPEVVRRLALSYAIAGERDASDATLLPLLQAQDLAAYRTRAFTLAIGGRTEEAMSIAETRLPARIAQRLAPYLTYMPRLTHAQQAAAANFGEFPHPTAIGVDDPAIAAYATGEPPRLASAPPTASDTRLAPRGELPALSSAAPVAAAPPIAAAPAAVTTAAIPAAASPSTVAPPQVAAGDTAPVSSSPAPPPVAVADAVLAQSPSQSPSQPPAALSSAPSSPSSPPAMSQPVVQPLPPAPVPGRAQLAEVFADFELQSERPRGPVSPDAVDVTTIVPARDAPLEAEPPVRRLTVNPSRNWVQLATGQDIGNFRYDWRRVVASANGLLEGQKAYFAAWGANSRLITGPFASESEAQALVTKLAASGVSSFVFTSTNGERVIPIP